MPSGLSLCGKIASQTWLEVNGDVLDTGYQTIDGKCPEHTVSCGNIPAFSATKEKFPIKKIENQHGDCHSPGHEKFNKVFLRALILQSKLRDDKIQKHMNQEDEKEHGKKVDVKGFGDEF